MGAIVSMDNENRKRQQHHREEKQTIRAKADKDNTIVAQGRANVGDTPAKGIESFKQHLPKLDRKKGVVPSSETGMRGSTMSDFHDGGSSFITDDEVKVNLAMADLMAFLLVVANNSSNLPLTRRDDPDIGKTKSALSSDEYARKSAAFIPADVRVIGGSFLKYGRVWDLPTSEEYTANDGAQEPGMFRNYCRT
jgi:hypothetical protein